MKRVAYFSLVAILSGASLVASTARLRNVWMGKQRDGSFVVSTGQRIEGDGIAFAGRPIDLALHPSGEFIAVLNKGEIFLCSATQVLDGTRFSLDPPDAGTQGRRGRANAAYRGITWSPDGKRVFASTDKGFVRSFDYRDGKLQSGPTIRIVAETAENPVPGGMAISAAGDRLYIPACNRGSVVEVDLAKNAIVRELAVQNLPFEARLAPDGKRLVVSNWGGRPPAEGERKSKTQNIFILVDEVGAPASGTVSLIDLDTGNTRHVEVGIHPTAIAIDGNLAYVANAMSDTVSVVDIDQGKVARTIPIRWGSLNVLGAMPNALAIHGKTLYACNGGDNAVSEIDLDSGNVLGFRHAGFFPTAIAIPKDGQRAFVVNTKGNGSVRRTNLGQQGNAHDFEGTVTVVDLTKPLDKATEIVARNNFWDRPLGKSKLKVYNGAIKHVLYIIKENRTYDEIFGDLPMGNGDPQLCSLGERVMPNHRKIAQEFTLFDNGYVSGTNSADGHAWSTQCVANDYLEHFYVGYSRTYPDDGDCAMSIAKTGCLWDAAAKKNLSIRVWGEFCDNELATFDPMPKDWFELWEDRKAGTNKFKFTADTTVVSLKPYINREVHYWPLLQSDQFRADVFIREYEQFSKEGKVPNLLILSLPCDHAEGLDPKYPTPRAMMADNDLALGRVVEAVTKSQAWKETCIFVVEDDAQSGPDHVDGHRTCFLAISPYTKRGYVDSTLYTQTNMIRSIEMMLGMDPMNKFDALAYPMENCFSEKADLSGYTAVPNNHPLDERNPSGAAMTEADKYWLEKSLELDWSIIDGPDPYWLNRINWYSIYKGTRPYPDRPGDRPGQFDEDDDD